MLFQNYPLFFGGGIFSLDRVDKRSDNSVVQYDPAKKSFKGDPSDLGTKILQKY